MKKFVKKSRLLWVTATNMGVILALALFLGAFSGCQPDDPEDPADDSWDTGPYGSVVIENTGPNNNYTVYYPEELDSDGFLNPIITWGNGGMTVPSAYPDYLPHFASHGFVVIAANTRFVGGEHLSNGIDWMVEQNRTRSSLFYQELDVDNVCAMGYSMGSLAAFNIADDLRLTTTVHISGGASGAASVQNMRNMTAFFCDENTTAANCQPDFDVSPVPVFYGVFKGTGHVGTMAKPYSTRVAGATVGWLRWRMLGDESKKKLFVGEDCTLCTNDNWIVQQKDLY
jgi:hypothetical protein